MVEYFNNDQIKLFPTYLYHSGKESGTPISTDETGYFRWRWQSAPGVAVQLECRFPSPVRLAGVSVELAPECQLETAELLDENGSCIGAYRAESGKSFGGCFDILTYGRGSSFFLRLTPTISDVALKAPQFFGAQADQTLLFPSPTHVEWLEGQFSRRALLCVACDGSSDAQFALSHFTKLAKERWGEAVSQKSGGLFIGLDTSLHTEEYLLNITPQGAALYGADRLALLYGLERFFELEKDGVLPAVQIRDLPYKAMRGIHMFLPHRSQLSFAERLIENMLIPFHYNHVILEFAGGMRFDTHPEISEGWVTANRLAKQGEIPAFPHGSVAGGELLEKDEVRALCEFMHDRGIEVIPEVQSFGHVQYITYAHPEIAEIDPNAEIATDERTADIPPSLFYHHSYCPQNPKSYEIIQDLIDEIVDVVRPRRFVHMGHDEIYQIGLCPKCKGIAPDKLFEMHVTAMHRYLAAKGLRMMLWADMVQPVTKYQCFPALERLPKDIVWLDFVWYFHVDRDIEENLLPFGTDVMIGNLYSSHFPRYEQRIAKERMIGGELSFWAQTNEKSLAKEGKFFDLMYTSEMLCSATYDHRARYLYTALIADRLETVRNYVRGEKPCLRYTAKPCTYKAPLAARPTELIHQCKQAGFAPTALQAPLEITVNALADGLRFVHTTLYREARIAWGELLQIGNYQIEYEDGTVQDIPVTYDGNVRCWKYRFGEPLKNKYYRHEGYVAAWDADPVFLGHTEAGDPITLLSLSWKNPHPDRPIKCIRCTEREESNAGLLLCAVETIDRHPE